MGGGRDGSEEEDEEEDEDELFDEDELVADALKSALQRCVKHIDALNAERSLRTIDLADATEEVIETKSSLSALRPMVCELYVVAIREAARSDIESVLDSSLFGKASRKALGNARPSVKFLERMEALMRVVLEVVTYH